LKTDFLKFWNNRSELKLNKKVFVFTVCLLISFFSWLQINLSKKQLENLPVKIQFTNLPKARFGAVRLADTLYVEVEADGYDLLKYEMREVQIEFRKLKRDRNPEVYYFLPNSYLKTIGKQMGENFKLVRSLTDTVQLNTSVR
jgi:hypothetical protein